MLEMHVQVSVNLFLQAFEKAPETTSTGRVLRMPPKALPTSSLIF
jgi:hypothetical protein